MPGLTPRDMNGYGDYNGPMRGGGSQFVANGSYPEEYYRSGFRDEDPYRRVNREDPYRENPYQRREDVYGRVATTNGRFNDVAGGDQNSLLDYAQHSNEPVFELDHLATYTAGTRSGVISVEDGLHRLRKMENTTGIWTMRCILIVERRALVVLDKSTGEELERFPMECIVDPTAVFKNDRREVYNNLILFTVVEDHRRKSGQGDLHIFQSISVASQEIVDEILAARGGGSKLGQSQRIPPPPSQRPPEPPGMYGMRSNVEQYAGPSGPRRPGNHIPFIQDGGQNEVLEKDVQLLNHCFDDIERFVARLQQAAEAYKELERRKRERGNRARKRQSGDGMLSHRARPPPASDFIDIFQKFKFSFNLLAKLKAHIHDPNAPELVHFLFTPLSLIYEASRDPFHGNRDLADQAISPVVNHEAKQLLLNCLTSKEIELWQALGPKWTTSREEWRGYTPPFNPVFYDGWRPSPSVIEDSPPLPPPQVPLEAAVLAHHNQIMNHTHESDTRPMPTYQEDDYQRRFEPPRPSPRPPSPRPPSPPRHAIQSTSAVYPEYVEQPQERNRHEMRRQSPTSSRDEENAAYLDELRRGGHQVYEALHERKGKNQKEISVNKGDILQVVDSSRKWWKVRNYKGEMGYAPYTILTEVKDLGYGTDLGRDRNSGNYNNFLPNDQPPAPPVPPPAPDISRSRQPKREDDYYYDDDLDNTTPPPIQHDRSARQQASPAEISAFQPPMPNGRPRSRDKTHQDILHDELREKMNSKGILQQQQVPPLKLRPQAANVYITRRSSPSEVKEWLEAKGFSDLCIKTLHGYSAQELFQLKKRDFERFIGHEEAVRLDGQLTLQKKTSGFETRGGKELRDILQRRKERAATSANEEAAMGHPPGFRPITPSDDEDSDDSSNDPHLAETGKTLRDLLIRQRKKIMENNVFDNPGHHH
ncbi:epidermal growth factor receptor kinase substrate 8-like isoform X3 [Haliotis cracherodii]|uniref:epidermal growth factor receptor kinase substrate 8-like isoform X3 n=1 Tax=Haliotis cracherodii TaxID=6455 RepID=UPI0039EA98B2